MVAEFDRTPCEPLCFKNAVILKDYIVLGRSCRLVLPVPILLA